MTNLGLLNLAYEKGRHWFAKEGPHSQSYNFSNSHVISGRVRP